MSPVNGAGGFFFEAGHGSHVGGVFVSADSVRWVNDTGV